MKIYIGKQYMNVNEIEDEFYYDSSHREYREQVQYDWVNGLEYEENVPKVEYWESYVKRFV